MDDKSDLFESELPEGDESESLFDRIKGKVTGFSDEEVGSKEADFLEETVDSGDQTLYDKIEGESTGLGRLLSKIPGIGGYMEKSRRREADQMLRKVIADRLNESRLQLSNVYQELTRDIIKAIDYAEPLGQVNTRLAGLIGKIESAPTGYAGFFSPIKIKEEELERIYAFDEQMLQHVDMIAASVAALEKATDGDGDVRGGIRDLNTAVQNAQLAFSERNELLAGIG